MEMKTEILLPDINTYEKIYVHNNLVYIFGTKEIVSSKTIIEHEEPKNTLEDIKENYILCNHLYMLDPLAYYKIERTYYSDIMLGKDIIKHTTYEQGYINELVDIAIVTEDKSVEFIEAVCENVNKLKTIKPNKEYRVSCTYNINENNYEFDFYKTNNFMFEKCTRKY